MYRIIGSLFLLSLLFFSFPAHARYDPHWKWRTVATEHFIVYYPEGHEALARRVLALEPEVYRDISGYLGVKPDPLPIVLNPGTDLLNGFYTPFPNRISLYETPVFTLRGFGSSTTDMMDLVFTHEYTHYVHITTRSGLYGAFTRVFGEGLGVMNAISPGWMLEGITTNTETLFTDGGRGRSPEFAGVIRSFTENERLWGLSAAGAENPYGPPPGRFYLAGYHMVEYLNRTYGPDAFARVSKRQGAHPLRLSGSALRYVTGKSPQAFYRGFLSDFNARTDSVRTAAAADGLPTGKVLLAERDDGFDSLFWTPAGTIRAVRTGYGKPGALVEIDPSTGGVLGEVRTGNLSSFGHIRPFPDGRLLFGAPFFHPLGMNDLADADLAALDPSRKKITRITRGAHVFQAAASPDGRRIAATSRNGMWIDLLVMDSDGGNIRKLVSRPGLLWDAPSWSPDGATVAAVVKDGGRNAIALVDAAGGEIRTPLAPDARGYTDPEFTTDGRSLVFTSDRSGVWNVYAFDIASGRLRRLTSVTWDAEEPHVSPDGKTLAFLSLSRGLRRVCVIPFGPETGETVDMIPGGRFEPLGRPPEVSGPIPESRGIPPLRAYTPYVRVPWTATDEKGMVYGVELAGVDPVGLNGYTAVIAYGTATGRPAYDVNLLNRSFWTGIGMRAYDTTFEGNTLGGGKSVWFRERGGEITVGFPVVHRIAPDIVRSSWLAGARVRMFDGLEETRVNRARDRSVALFGEVTASRTPDAAPKDLVPGMGQDAMVTFEGSINALGSELPGHSVTARITQYAPSPVSHHGFALSLAGMNQRGHLHYDTAGIVPRGYENDTSDGGFDRSNILAASLEYHVPLWYADRGLGMTALHLHLLRGSLFVDHGAGWSGAFRRDDWAGNVRTSIGATLRTELTVLAILPLDIGVAAGYKTIEREGFARVIVGGVAGGAGAGAGMRRTGPFRTPGRGWSGMNAPRWGL